MDSFSSPPFSLPLFYAQRLQSYPASQPHHNVRHTAKAHLLHGGHEQHPGVYGARRFGYRLALPWYHY